MLGEFGGDNGFPTEAELCKKYDVSRFTIREALRTLSNEGLISRRRGSGTIIQPASARAGALHQPLSNVGEILQYARDTSILFEAKAAEILPTDIAEQIGIIPDGKWHMFRGLRLKEGRRRPIAVTLAWVHPDLESALADFDPQSATIFGQLQMRGGIKITQITQAIQAISATEEIASDLGIEKGDPVLRILRCYYDQNEGIFEISASFHPGERFAYSMHIDVGK
ncbi:GntR family transcriptional regulator [Sphingorhabdus lutea]|uniref:GntR family transcriptional regulator n=1 Tax=Sphingorhabdus lutea TaxID=1913578 RepID=A0A1L3JE84_9SPHN|nr:GntR family transcriptional regulator [Sphingorhabdus lutea]